MQGVVGKREGCVVDASSVVAEDSGLVTSSVVTGSPVALMVVWSGAVDVATVEISVGVVMSTVAVMSTGVG